MKNIVQPSNPKDELISKLNSKSISLSYSSLKSFTTPLNFINYKLDGFSQTPSMIFGSLCDCLLLTPDNFEKEFKIINNIPTSDNQVSFSNALIEIGKNQELTDEVIVAEFSNHYKRGKALDVYDGLKEYVLSMISGKQLITQDIYDEAKSICDNLLENEDIQLVFSQIQDVQKKIIFNYKGWDIKGFYDILLNDHIIDLKFSRDANPERFERDIANYDYYLQAAIYCYAAKELGISENPKYSFIVYDKSFNYSIIELDYSYIIYGTRKFKYLIEQLDKCIAESRFDESYGFFNRTYKAYKPKWVKGFELESSN